MLLHDEGPRRNHLGFLEVASTTLPCSLRSLQGACRTEDLWCRLTEGVGGGGGAGILIVKNALFMIPGANPVLGG